MPVANVNWDSEEEKIIFDEVYTSGGPNAINHSLASNLSSKTYGCTGGIIGDYALIASGYVNSVNAYNASLTRSSPTSFTTALMNTANANVMTTYTIFANGITTSNAVHTEVNAYNTSLTRTQPRTLIIARYMSAGTNVGSYALFGGGGTYNQSTSYSYVDTYNQSLTRSSTNNNLSKPRMYLGGAQIGGYALFAGGLRAVSGNNSYVTDVDVYDSSLTKSTATQLTISAYPINGIRIGNYAIFIIGRSTINAYDLSLTRSNVTAPSTGAQLGARIKNRYVIIYNSSNSGVDIYNESLTKSIGPALSETRDNLAASSVGNYALFAGGYKNSSGVNTVDAYEELGYILDITIPPFSKYKFTESTEQLTYNDSVTKTYSQTSSPISGYIKPCANDTIEGLQS